MQHSYLLRAPLIMAGLIILSACSDSNAVQRELLLSELREAETNRTMLSEAVRGRRLALASLEQRLSEQQSGLQAYRDKVEAYMMNHKMAVAAIASAAGGSAVALDSENEFSDEAQAVGGLVGAIGVAYTIANFEEVSTVFDQLMQADAHVKRLEAQIADTRAGRQAEDDLLRQEEETLREISTEIEQIRSELRALH